MNSNNFVLTVLLFITFIPGLFFTLPTCTIDKENNLDKWTKIITHAILFTIALFFVNLF
jgi:NADH:ubiquinone oxidoreductase subunit 3 (subunit A)